VKTFEDDPDYYPGGVTDCYGDVGMVVHRSYDYDRDGWRQHQLQPGEYPVTDMARQVLAMEHEINFLRRRLWQAEKELGVHRKRVDSYFGLGRADDEDEEVADREKQSKEEP